MHPDLPPPLAAYFDATNRHDVDAMLRTFAPDATVRDEGENHQGEAAIHAWIAETTRKYAVTVTVEAAETTGDHVRVAGRVSGNFPGSPATLRYDFGLRGDRIASLAIGA